MANLFDLTGMTFGQLHVLGKTNYKSVDGNSVYLCRCRCGNELRVDSYKLENHMVANCGNCANSPRQRRINALIKLNRDSKVNYVETHNKLRQNHRDYCIWYDEQAEAFMVQLDFQGKTVFYGKFSSERQAAFALQRVQQKYSCLTTAANRESLD